MTTEALAAAEDAGDVIDTTDANAEQQSEPAETEARAGGWLPKEEFKGPAEKWVDADTFVERGREISGFVKKHNEKLTRDLEKANKEIAGMKSSLKEATEFFSKAEERAYKSALRDIEARMNAAVDAGDNAAALAITKEATELTAEMKAGAKPAEQTDPAAVKEAFDVWVSDNAWFESDQTLKTFAIGVGQDLAAKGIEPLKQFAEITRRVKAEFPEKFGNPRRQAAAAVEGAQNGRRTSAKGWADLPAEAKAMADRFVKQGFVASREAYLKNYDWS